FSFPIPIRFIPAHPDTFSGSGRGYRDSTKRNMPKRWFDKLPHTHVALDDALGQGALFCNMLEEARAKGR
ncbi:MAG TPA: hypothetical protein PK867_03115, partial [Pirellulales bacterium]|nr:hypothetical protein [Pirellulales bacterium]